MSWQKRLQSEIAKTDDAELTDLGIKLQFDEGNMSKAYAVIEGPADTPYYGGYFGFEIEYPATYPFDPPRVRFANPNREVRWNPNLYNCGKVCLSILNTFIGPPWESIMSTRTVLVALFMHVFQTKQPIQNEPALAKNVDERYNAFLRHASIKYATPGSVRPGVPRDWAVARRAAALPKLLEHVAAQGACTHAATIRCFGGTDRVDFKDLHAALSVPATPA